MACPPAAKRSSPAAEQQTQIEPCLPGSLAAFSSSVFSPCVLCQRLVQLCGAVLWLDFLAQSTPVHRQDNQVDELRGCGAKTATLPFGTV